MVFVLQIWQNVRKIRMTDQPLAQLPEQPFSELSRADQRRALKAADANITQLTANALQTARAIAAQNYLSAIEIKGDMIASDIGKSRDILSKIKDLASEYLDKNASQTVEDDQEVDEVVSDKGTFTRTKKRSLSGEVRARTKMGESITKMEMQIAKTVTELGTIGPFMGEQNINIQKNEYQERLTRTSGPRGADAEVEGEIVDEELKEITG